MLFNSLEFLIFLPVVLLIYHRLGHRRQNLFLLGASCFFYGSWDWRFLAPLLISTSIDYYCARRMEDLIEAGAPIERRRPFVVFSLVSNLGLLGFFKYYNFFSENLHALLGAMGFSISRWTLEIILPVGISFYTFQALSYTIDVYRGQLHATRHFADFLLAVLYFPHLVAGPIQRANNLLAQVTSPRVIDWQRVSDGLHLIFWGYFKKVFVADNLAPIANQVFAQTSPDGFQTLIGVYAFCFQIYCDFSGYTDIARGVAKLMGFEFMLNFNLPYFATNPQDFWKRWHISLSSWLRDYLYISLGGNRRGIAMMYRNLMLTMVIGGFWHGAAWNFILWGFYHGALLVLHRLLDPFLTRIFDWPGRLGRGISFGVRLFVMFQLTNYGWLLFRAVSLEQVIGMTRSMFLPYQQVDWDLALRVLLYALPLIVVQCIQYFSGKLEFLSFSWVPLEARAALYAAVVYFVVFRGGQPQAFIYFQF